jgi:hypothetical protein
MLPLIAFLVAAAVPENGTDDAAMSAILAAETLTLSTDERGPHLVPALRERSKKELWLAEKARRPDVRVEDADGATAKHRSKDTRPKKTLSANQEAEVRLAESMQPVGARIQPIATLFNLWNRESLPLLSGRPYKRPFQLFLRDHYTKESTLADTRLATILAAAALKFRSNRVEVVSGYRSPKYNLMLRKKGHQVARESQHMQGTAVDFRVRGVSTEALRDFVQGLRLGGVGYYPRTHFIHADTGKVRTWTGS